MTHGDNIIAKEAAILGSVLVDNALWVEVASLDETCFSLTVHQQTFKRMKELFARGVPVDAHTMSDAHGIDVVFLSSLIDGVVEDKDHLKHHVATVREDAGRRQLAKRLEDVAHLAGEGLCMADLCDRVADLQRLRESYQSTSATIRRFDAIPDLMTMEIRPVDYLVQGLIPTRSLTLWSGIDGAAKTFLAQNLAIAVSTGGKFLGAQCRHMPVLYLDYENPDFSVRDRLELMGMSRPANDLRIWGTWLQDQPPAIGNPLLCKIAKASQPLMIFDPFRYSHEADENDSTEMMAVMRDLRACVVAGATVIILHHPAKVEGSTGRGSTAIRGAVDLAFLQEMSDETGLITLRCGKNRFGERPVLTIQPNFEEGRFGPTGSPAFTKMLADVEALSKIIHEKPWQSQNEILEGFHGNRQRGIKLLRDNTGIRWKRVEKGRSILYGPMVPEAQNYVAGWNHATDQSQDGGIIGTDTRELDASQGLAMVPEVQNHAGTDGTDGQFHSISSTVPPLIGGNCLDLNRNRNVRRLLDKPEASGGGSESSYDCH